MDWEIPNLEFGSNQCIIKILIDEANYDLINNLNLFQINPAPFINIVNNKDTVKTNMPFKIRIKSKNIDNLSYSLHYSLTRGEFDFVVVQEAPDFETLAAIKIAVESTGMVTDFIILEDIDLNAIASKSSKILESFKAPGE